MRRALVPTYVSGAGITALPNSSGNFAMVAAIVLASSLVMR
jgi:hypothetical protein